MLPLFITEFNNDYFIPEYYYMSQKMFIVCLDLEGVLIPEIWHEVAKQTNNNELLATTREIPDLKELFAFRLNLLKKEQIRLIDLQNIITKMEPLPGAADFLNNLREVSQVIILSDIFQQFYDPFASKLGYPTIMCHSLGVDSDGLINRFDLRLDNQKQKSVEAFKELKYKVIAAGDSFNDLSMILNADLGILYNPPQVITSQYPNIPVAENHDQLLLKISQFIQSKGN